MENNNITKLDKDLEQQLKVNGSKISYIDNTEKTLRTDDYDLAVTLFHTGARLLSIDKDGSNKLIYVFKRICNLEVITDEFFSDLFDVKAFSFLESVKAFNMIIDKNLNKNNK